MSRQLEMLPSGETEWYAEGIRFSCTGSAKCCKIHGEYAYVFFTRDEERAIAEELGLSVRRFRRRHTKRISSGQRTLRFPEGDCTFLDEGLCSIYLVRPKQCRTWPFWPENMGRRVWERDVAAFCPGVGRGRLYTVEEIRAALEGRASAADVG